MSAYSRIWNEGSSHPEVFLGKDVRKICSKFTGEHLCRSVISIKLQSKFIEITIRHGCSPVNLLHIFRTPFPENTSEGMLLVFLLNESSPQSSLTQYKLQLGSLISRVQKQRSRGVLQKRCSENVQPIYRRTPMPKCDFS